MPFNKYTRYDAADFAQDEDFIRWIKHPTPEDEAFWEAFLLQHPDQRPEVEEASAMVAAMIAGPNIPALTGEEKSAMLRAIHRQAHRRRQPIPLQLGRRRWLPAAAAAIVLLLGVATWLYWGMPFEESMITHATSYGEQQSIELPDGSLVKLNAHSSLSYKPSWNDSESRKVWLKGEAFFEVSPKPQIRQKFQVITEDLTVEVLGTVFNVNSHREQTKVFLEEGKVQLSLNGLKEKLLMDSGELVTYSKSEQELPAKQKVPPMIPTSWKDGFQLFEQAPLKEVLEKMEEIYGVTLQIKDTVDYDRKITTGLPVENLEKALSVLEVTLELQISKDNDTYIIQ